MKFDPTKNLRTESWTTVVIDHFRFASFGEISILLIRPFNRETQADSDLVLIVVLFNLTSNAQMLESLALKEVTLIIGTTRYSDKQPKFQIHALRHASKKCGCQGDIEETNIIDRFHDKYKKWRGFLTGQDAVRNMTRIFSKIAHQNLSNICNLVPFTLPPLNRLPKNYYLSLPNGVGVYTGLLGKGRTHWTVQNVIPFVHSNHQVDSRIKGQKVLVTSPNNGPAEE